MTNADDFAEPKCIETGDFFVPGGQVIYMAEIGDAEATSRPIAPRTLNRPHFRF
jgi:hypothetical protein